MQNGFSLDVREEGAPVWARLAPFAYLAACAGCVRAIVLDRTLDFGVTGLLVGVGLAPAFALPAIFATRRARLVFDQGGLSIDGRSVKVDDARVEVLSRGRGLLRLDVCDSRTRTFLLASYEEGKKLVALLPPASAPAGALAA